MQENIQLHSGQVDNISALRFVRSKLFSNLFAEGMEMVEETATYLDGEGKEQAKSLTRGDALAYASTSMRLTTRLMQIASWLLVLRAVREEEMSYADAAEKKYRLGAREIAHPDEQEDSETSLPERLIELRQETNLLYDRIARIDDDIFSSENEHPLENGDAMGQLQTLHNAFSTEG
ncbi:MAG: protease adaptor protein RcdA [bacterium]